MLARSRWFTRADHTNCDGHTHGQVIRDMEFFFPSLETQFTERTLGVIKPGTGEDVESYILNSIWASGIFVVFQKKDFLTREQVQELYNMYRQLELHC